MDGTIYLDNMLFDKSLEFLAHIREIGGKYIFMTNNSSKSVDDYIKKVRALSIEADKSNFLTSSQATALYLMQNYKGKKIYAFGTESLKKEFRESDLLITDKYEDGIDCLVIGYDTELTYSKLVDASKLLVDGTDFIATNPDLVCPTIFGYVPDCGSFCYMLEVATKRKPIYIGKPNKTMVELAIQYTGYSKDETIVIGDRIYTDIASGINAGVTTCLVLSGETKMEDVEKSVQKPDYIFQGIGELYSQLLT